MNEMWKKIDGFDNYSVSNHGRIRNDKEDRILCTSIRSKTSDYYSVLLPVGNGKYKHRSVHRLVAIAFVENADGKPQVNHIDGDKHNNRADNLEWTTASENSIHAFDNGLRTSTSEQITKAINSRKRKVANLTLGTTHDSITDAAKAIRGIPSGISKCLNGSRNTYHGMRFAYIG